MAGVVGQLYGFDWYYSSANTDSFYTAFPGNEILGTFSLRATNYFYLFSGQKSGTVPIYRYYAQSPIKDHFYTRIAGSYGGYALEGIIGYGYTSSGSSRIAIYRWWNSTITDHAYTTSNSSPGSGYVFEGIAWYSPIVVNGCSDPNATNYNPDVNQTSSGCTYQPPSVSFSITRTSICRGSTATLSWNVTGVVSSVSINQNIGTVAASGSRTVGPTSTTTYTITATGPGGTTTRSVILTVNQPTTTSITADSTAIIRGQCTTLRWTTTGDATGASISPGIGTVNINGNRQVCPSETTRYTISVTGICTNSTSSVTVTVYQPPTVTLTGPVSLNYGQQGTLSYNATNADISLRITPTYNYKNGALSGGMFVVNLPIGSVSNGQIITQIPYNDFGPFSVTYVIVATGNGGQETKQITIPINIDETPDNFLVPESTDLLKAQNPVFTPDAVVTSYEIKIEGIDIPIEVKADKPILIDKNRQQDWKRIRKI
jgi:hypothetical protein